MTLDPWLVGLLLALGGIAGFLAGLLGVGGGALVVPFLSWALAQRGVVDSLAVKMAIATSMATIVLTSLSSLRAHHRIGAVRWDLVRAIAPGIALGGLLAGAAAFAWLDGRWLALLFALFIAASATQMLRRRAAVRPRAMPGAAGSASAGAAIGFLSGLVGAGGAFVSVPFMTRYGVPIHQAVATSAALGLPIALAGTAGYLVGGRGLAPALPGAVGYLYLPGLALIALASVLVAPFGARCAHALDVVRLRRAFALLMYALAAYMAAKSLA